MIIRIQRFTGTIVSVWLVTEKQILPVLENYIEENKWYFVNSHEHSCGLKYFNGNYYFYDANKGFFKKFTNTSVLASKIFSALSKKPRLGIITFDTTAPSAIDLAHIKTQEILNQDLIESVEKDKVNYTTLAHAADTRDTYTINFFSTKNKLTTINEKCYSNKSTPLELAASNAGGDILRQLLLLGAKPNLKNKTGASVIFNAAARGNTEALIILCNQDKYLKEKNITVKCNINNKTKAGNTALIQAAMRGNHDNVVLLCEHKAKVNLSNNLKKTALNYATKNGHLNCIKTLLEYKADPNLADTDEMTPLLYAAQNGMVDAVALLLSYNADISQRNNEQNNISQLALLHNHPEILEKIHDMYQNRLIPLPKNDIIFSAYIGDIEALKIGLSHQNANLETDKAFALIAAVYGNQLTIIEMLILHHPPLYFKNYLTYDTLCLAALNDNEQIFIEILNYFLLNNNSEIDFLNNVKNKDYNSINNIITESSKNNLIPPTYLNAALWIAVSTNDTMMVEFLLMHPHIDLTIENLAGETLLQKAVQNDNLDMVKILINADKRPKPDIRGKDGMNAFMWACKNNNIDIAAELYKRCYHIDATDHQGKTALMHAAENDAVETVSFLIACGANINTQDKEGNTAQTLSAQHHDKTIYNMLICSGPLTTTTSTTSTTAATSTFTSSIAMETDNSPPIYTLNQTTTFFNEKKRKHEEETDSPLNKTIAGRIKAATKSPVKKTRTING